MLYLIMVVSLISLGFNITIYKRITATYVVGSVEEFQLETVEPLIEPEPVVEEAHDPPITTAMVQEVYSAWKNQKEIPWVPPTKAPEPLIEAPNRGPLARPDGFV